RHLSRRVRRRRHHRRSALRHRHQCQRGVREHGQVRARSAREWGDLVRAASPHKGPWPRVSVWHGGADPVVKPENADEIIKQWTDVHGLNDEPTLTETVDGFPRQVWLNRAGDNVIESYTIPSMAHGTPLATGGFDEHCG